MTIQELIVLSESKLTSLNGEMVVAIQRGDIDEIKRWNGSAWEGATLKRWNGAAWVSV